MMQKKVVNRKAKKDRVLRGKIGLSEGVNFRLTFRTLYRPQEAFSFHIAL